MGGFPEPRLLTLGRLTEGHTKIGPILEMIPHMTSLTALVLKWEGSFPPVDLRDTFRSLASNPKIPEVTDPPKELLSHWMGSLTSTQLNQLQYVELNMKPLPFDTVSFSQFSLPKSSSDTEILHWLKQMPHIKSLVLRNNGFRNAKTLFCSMQETLWHGTLDIPPLDELRQLYVGNILSHQIELGIQPALTRLTLRCKPSNIPSRWFPSLAGMTSLESLLLGDARLDALVEMSSYLPTQLVNFTCRAWLDRFAVSEPYINKTGWILAGSLRQRGWD